jgi:phenylacetate-CoA ligase
MIKQKIVFIITRCLHYFRKFLRLSETSYKLLFTPGFEKVRWQVGKWKAWMIFLHARKNIPAYRDFLKIQNYSRKYIKTTSLNPKLETIPETSKQNYIKKYTIEERCVGGKLPLSGVMIDESSGSSGTPNNWVRGTSERLAVKNILQFAFHQLLGEKQVIVLNAFALGPWATGMNVSMSVVDVSILKSTGPDIDKIVNTLELFGSKYEYVIMGYPPFLKALVDDSRIKWSDFNISAIFGGEGMSEGMRDYLGKHFNKLYSSYGASDLEINIACENDMTIALRREIIKNDSLRKKILKGPEGTLPMIFQYNPLDYYIETNKNGELIVTVCRTSNLSHRVRYNIQDTGHILRMPELQSILAGEGVDTSEWDISNDLPLLFHYGRSDLSIAFYGCKITPGNIEEIIFSLTEVPNDIYSFSLLTEEDKNSNKILTLALEMKDGVDLSKYNPNELANTIFSKLQEANQDYQESVKMIPTGMGPRVSIHKNHTGPFKDTDIRVKMKYIQTQ